MYINTMYNDWCLNKRHRWGSTTSHTFLLISGQLIDISNVQCSKLWYLEASFASGGSQRFNSNVNPAECCLLLSLISRDAGQLLFLPALHPRSSSKFVMSTASWLHATLLLTAPQHSSLVLWWHVPTSNRHSAHALTAACVSGSLLSGRPLHVPSLCGWSQGGLTLVQVTSRRRSYIRG